MCSSSVCCCFLLKYWISSKYNNTPPAPANVSSSSTTALISAVEAVDVYKRQVLTQEYADMIHADYYSRDAMCSVRYANELFGH